MLDNYELERVEDIDWCYSTEDLNKAEQECTSRHDQLMDRLENARVALSEFVEAVAQSNNIVINEKFSLFRASITKGQESIKKQVCVVDRYNDLMTSVLDTLNQSIERHEDKLKQSRLKLKSSTEARHSHMIEIWKLRRELHDKTDKVCTAEDLGELTKIKLNIAGFGGATNVLAAPTLPFKSKYRRSLMNLKDTTGDIKEEVQVIEDHIKSLESKVQVHQEKLEHLKRVRAGIERRRHEQSDRTLSLIKLQKFLDDIKKKYLKEPFLYVSRDRAEGLRKIQDLVNELMNKGRDNLDVAQCFSRFAMDDVLDKISYLQNQLDVNNLDVFP